MLFKNDVKYDLTAQDYKAMATVIGCSYKDNNGKLSFIDFPKGGVVIAPPPPVKHTNPDGTQTFNKRHFEVIPYEQSLETTEGTVKWNYCQRPPVIEPGKSPVYGLGQEGNERLITHRESIQQNQPDLLFFLCCISRCGGHVEGSNLITYYIENKKAEATKELNKRMEKVEVESHIIHPTTRMHRDDIARIAQAMRVEGVEEMTEEETRYALLQKIEVMENSEKKDGYKTFKEYTESSGRSRTELLAGLQMLKEKNFIKYASTSNTWGVINKEGKRIAKLCPLSPGKDPHDSLVHHVVTNEETRETVEKLIKEAINESMPAQ